MFHFPLGRFAIIAQIEIRIRHLISVISKRDWDFLTKANKTFCPREGLVTVEEALSTKE
jgi:hypothetical protein